MNEVIGYVDVRSAEVATDAIAADVAQVHQDMLDADADASAAAASAAAAAGTLANAVKKTGEANQSIAGDVAVAGDLSAGGDLAVTGDAGVQGNLSVLGDCDFNAEVKVRTPVNNTDAASKKYVDDADALKISITDINTYALGLTGNQDFSGTKIGVDSYIGVKATSPNFDEGSTSASGYEKVLTQVFDSQNNLVFDERSVRSAANMRTHRQVLFNTTSDNKSIVAYLDLRIADDGTVSLLLIKTVNGAETGRQTLANITT